MSGGARYWNEETQRWEDGDGDGGRAVTGPVTPPPPARPGAVPTWPPGVSGGGAADVSAGGGAAASVPSGGGETVTGGPPAPVWPPAVGAGGVDTGTVAAPADAGATSDWPPAEQGPRTPSLGSVSSPASTGRVPAVSPAGSSPTAPPPPPPGWPGTGTGSTWHGPGVAGAPSGGWSSVEEVGGGAVPSAEWSGTSWSSAGPTTVTAPPTGRNRRLVWSVLIGAAAVGVATTLVLTLVVGGGDEDDKAVDTSPTPTGTVSQQSDPYPSPTPTPTEETASPFASEPELPAGYELYEDQEGFRIGRPVGWSRSTVASQFGIDIVNYRSADGERRLQVYQIAEESPEASFALYLSDDTPKPDGFEKLDLRPVEEGGFTGERLEYVADSLKGEPDVGPWHVYDERFVAQDGFIYAIAAYGLEKDGPEDELELLTSALQGFCAPYACDAASID
ncbi:hypothetical protein AB0D34_29085 [Streptomyces sp. NPDC048420]|uniref:hypothetical protein n=1 Tax=Streptomyces sp. NPDC048420 TaxID=3155755 RepID=UPI00344911AB